jgi:putative ABC transport system permease protein
MRKILMLAFANIRGARSQSLTLAGFVMLAATTLNLGLLLFINYPGAYDAQSEIAHAPHFASLTSTLSWGTDRQQFVQDYPDVREVALEPVLAESTTVEYNGAVNQTIVIVSSVERDSGMDLLELTKDSQPLRDDSVYLPSVMHVGGGYEIGDEFMFSMGGEVFSFTVAGFTDEMFFNAAVVQCYRATVTQSTFADMQRRIPVAESVLLTARMGDPANATQLDLDYQARFSGETRGVAHTLTYESIRFARTFMATTVSLIMAAVAAVVVLVCLVVLRFRVRIGIEEQMHNIGALKAIGYTSGLVSGSIVVQNLSITAVGVVAGVGVSYAVLPWLSQLLEVQSALPWHPSLDLACLALSVAVIGGAVLLVVGLTVSAIPKLAPLTALRSGLEVHSFSHNSLPLDSTNGPLGVLLACKSALQAKGQMVMVALIVAAASFTASAVLSTFYNIGVDNEGFVLAAGGEVPDVAVQLTHTPLGEVLEQLDDDPAVRKAFRWGEAYAMLADTSTWVMITPDYSVVEGRNLFEGRYPQHANEIAVGAAFRGAQGIRIGDTVTLTLEGTSATLLVTGLLQSMNNNGYLAALTNEGARGLMPGYESNQIYIYLNDPSQAETWAQATMDRLQEPLPPMILSKIVHSQLAGYADTLLLVSALIVAITALVVALILYSVLNTAISQKRRQLGIYKSIGYTSGQLIGQISLTYVPIIAVAVLIGCALGYVGFLPLVTALFSTLGIYQLMMSPSVLMTVLLAVGLIIFAYLLTTLVAGQVRKVSAYSLVSE